jgi:hypothetical protein
MKICHTLCLHFIKTLNAISETLSTDEQRKRFLELKKKFPILYSINKTFT